MARVPFETGASRNSVELIEVKAKSFDPLERDTFYNKTALKKGVKKLNSEWEPYLLDIAFQTFVVRSAFPKWKVTSALMLANKTATASVEGLNQRFFLQRSADGRISAEVTPGTSQADLGSPLLTKVSVDDEVNHILASKIDGNPFEGFVGQLAAAYKDDRRIQPKVGAQCKSCEFRIDNSKKLSGLESGFENCWIDAKGLKPTDFVRPLVFDIWNFRKSDKLIEDGRFFMDELVEDDIKPQRKEGEAGLSSSERQWLQVEKVQRKDNTPYIDTEGLSAEIASWNFPLHFIDFETTMVAIPFNKGRKPYEQIAFQFSHHVVTESGNIEHRTQYINMERGHFPNFDFVRALKKALNNDSGTIFRFAAHENTVLCQIFNQLKASEESDRNELMAWIQTVTTATDDSVEKWDGQRSMVDMCELVKRYFFHPATGGSNSIKKVLPAILSASAWLQERYGKPVYGASKGIFSLNYKNWQWIQRSPDGVVQDPYKLLPPIFSDLDLEAMDSLITEGSIADGGAAMTAYARMQFTQMSPQERERVTTALLKYCELDTFAMVMIYEYWKYEIARRERTAA